MDIDCLLTIWATVYSILPLTPAKKKKQEQKTKQKQSKKTQNNTHTHTHTHTHTQNPNKVSIFKVQSERIDTIGLTYKDFGLYQPDFKYKIDL